MLKRLLDRHNHHRRRVLAIDGEAPPEVHIHTDPRASVDAVRLVRAWHKEDQRNARVLKNVFEPVDPVIAAPVRDVQCAAIISNFDEAGSIALWRAIQTLSVSGGENQKW